MATRCAKPVSVKGKWEREGPRPRGEPTKHGQAEAATVVPEGLCRQQREAKEGEGGGARPQKI
eukprot:14848499-Heterocapsa_arctica.AAC.1